MDKQRGSAAVDDILEELRQRPPAAPAGQSVDDILAEIGSRKAAPPAPPVDSLPASPPMAPAAPSQTPPPAAPAEPAEVPAAPPASPPAAVARAAAPAQAAPEASDFVPEAALPETFDGGEWYEEPVDAEAEATPAQKRKERELTATIYDIDLNGERVDTGPRLGKAAALDKVDPAKFSGDTELLSWFSGEDEAPMATSKKEQKQIDKMKKRREAAERRAEKARTRSAQEDESFFPQAGDDAAPEPEEDEVKLWRPAAEAERTERTEAPPPGGEFFQEEAPAGQEAAPEGFFREVPPIGGMAAAVPPQPAPPPESAPRAEAALPEDGFFREAPPAPPAAISPPPMPAGEALFAAPRPAPQDAAAPAPRAEAPLPEDAFFREAPPAGDLPAPEVAAPPEHDTKSFDIEGEDAHERVPTAAFTQEFDTEGEAPSANKNLYLDEMVDDRFREFFSETVILDSKEQELQVAQEAKGKRRRKKSRSAVLTGEFGKLAQQAEQAERAASEANVEADDDFEDYNRPQDAEAVEKDIASLCTTLSRRTVATAVIGLLALWMSLSHAGLVPLENLRVFPENPLAFAITYLVLVLLAIVINFTTVASGLVGLAGEPTVDSPPALAAVAGLLQGVMLLVNVISNKPPVTASLVGAATVLMLAFNALGKRVRAGSIRSNFQLASAGFDHSAGYVLDNSNELSYSITKGLAEEYPSLLVSRPTALVKGFLRQSFSQRATDRRARILGWVLLGAGVAAAVITWLLQEDLFTAVSAFAATLCIAVPFSSSLVSGVPSHLLQRATARVGAVVPGWSAIEELGQVNVVMAGSRDIFPPNVVQLKGIKTFEKERIDLAILYAASVLIEGCDTLRDIFTAVIQSKSDMLYKVESLTLEPGRGFTAWVQNSRIVIGSREILQKHGIEPPAVEVEMKFVPADCFPVYLAVSGKLFAMFIVRYTADADVADTLKSLGRSGVSLLVQSSDMNLSAELVERVYDLPPGVVKVLGHKELEMLEPLTAYLPESEGVMTHIGSFSSFIGGIRAAAGCAAAEKMSNVVQIASAVLACVLCVLLVLSQGLAGLPVYIILVYQLGWTLLVSLLPFLRRY